MYVKQVFHIKNPRNVYIENLMRSAFAIPNGKDTYVLIPNNLPINDNLSLFSQLTFQ